MDYSVRSRFVQMATILKNFRPPDIAPFLGRMPTYFVAGDSNQYLSGFLAR